MFECWNDLWNLSDLSSRSFYVDNLCQREGATFLIELFWEIKVAVAKSVIPQFLNEGLREIGCKLPYLSSNNVKTEAVFWENCYTIVIHHDNVFIYCTQ